MLHKKAMTERMTTNYLPHTEGRLTLNTTPSFRQLPDLVLLNKILYVFLVLALLGNAFTFRSVLTAPATQ